MAIDRRVVSWMIVATLTAGLTAFTTVQALHRYHDLRTGWSWDLAYYNQWFWALTEGDGVLSVRPLASYGTEGPSIWKMNYLAPIRFILAPIYKAFPDPRTLLVIQNVMFWWLIPAAYTLVRSESKSEAVALSAVALVPLTPLLWPLVWNDFRELQLVFPFVLWAVQGVRSRRVRLTAAGVAGMLACRQEFAVVVASLAFLPAREPEDLSRKAVWRLVLFDVGLIWLLFGFFGYLKLMVGSYAPERYIDQFTGPKASIPQTLETAGDMLWNGAGGWPFFAAFAPGAGILALPWIWSLCNGRWALRLLSGESWHHVRYAAPMVSMLLAAGLVGYAQWANWLSRRWGGMFALGLSWVLAAILLTTGLSEVLTRMEGIPIAVGKADVEPFWSFARQVGPDDGVLAAYEFTAPLSSRKLLCSYIMDANKPRGFPQLGPEFQWMFIRGKGLDPQIFVKQGFTIVYSGETLIILRRPGAG
ncbi:MAG: DUF2079 domain-containing protein [Paludisphaera borealis]|uniref:DUF2079 domain-containing protein n=1 Tax=Paludisphaera borealis TaxID=1387353 RepID=UPI002852148D|nr:DUF2079 domain-containing protein [Paludisphaera borealis]MDR3617986.1 DUF2079 domain-containing protein [Paludisphaera borealis]